MRHPAPARWEHFEHEADVGVRGYGTSKTEALVQLAIAMTAVVTDPKGVIPRVPVPIACDAPDELTLITDWLNALVFEMAVRRMLFSRFEITLIDHHLTATAWGEPIDIARHRPAVEIKGATQTLVGLSRQPGGSWCAQCVMDV